LVSARKTIAAISSNCDRISQAAPQEARQPRDIERIDQRRPQELQRIGGADQREQADGAEIDAGLGPSSRTRPKATVLLGIPATPVASIARKSRPQCVRLSPLYKDRDLR